MASCCVCHSDRDQESLVRCDGESCAIAKHSYCFDIAVPVGGFFCEACEIEKEEEESSNSAVEPSHKRAKVERSSLLEFVQWLSSGEQELLNKALGALKEDIAALPSRERYFAMSESERGELEEGSLARAYLVASPTCSEVFAVLKLMHKSRSSPPFLLVVEILKLLIEANFFKATINNTRDIVKKVMSRELRTMNKVLESAERGPCMAVLLLLRTVAATGDVACSEIARGIKGELLEKLLRDRGQRDRAAEREYAVSASSKDNLRSFVVKLVVSLIRHADAELKNVLISETAFVGMAFASLSTHNPSTVDDAVNMLERCIVKDNSLKRKAKTALFSKGLLRELGVIFTRRPSAELAQFLEHLLTHHLEGIAFPEDHWAPLELGAAETDLRDGVDSGDGGGLLRQSSNMHLLPFLEELRPWVNLVHRDLMLTVFQECPRIVPEYFRRKEKLFFPRTAASWLGLMSFVRVCAARLEMVEPLQWVSKERVVELAERVVFPSPTPEQWRKALTSEVMLVKLTALDTLALLLMRCRSLGKQTSLKIAALDEIQKSRLPPMTILQNVVKTDKADSESACMILGAALRCINLYLAVFGVSQAMFDLPVAVSMSCWVQVQALVHTQFGTHWWQNPSAHACALVFRLSVQAREGNQHLAGEALASARALLKMAAVVESDTTDDLVWLDELKHEENVEFFLSAFVAVANKIDGESESCAQLMSQCLKCLKKETGDSSLLHAEFVARVLRRFVHRIGVRAWMIEQLKDFTDFLKQGSDSVTRVLAVSMREYLEFAAGRRAKFPESSVGCVEAVGAKMPRDWWASARKTMDLSTRLGHVVAGGLSSRGMDDAENVDERLCEQAFFYLENLTLTESVEALCFVLLWRGLEGSALSSLLVSRCLESRKFISKCMTSACEEGLLCLGELLCSKHARRSELGVVGEEFCRNFSARCAQLVSLISWSRVKPEDLKKVALTALENGNMVKTVFRGMWPSLRQLPCWVRSFRDGDGLSWSLGEHLDFLEPSSELVESVRASLLAGGPWQELTELLLTWSLFGVAVADSNGKLARCLLSLPSSDAVAALLVVCCSESRSIALDQSQRDQPIPNLVPAICSLQEVSKFERWTESLFGLVLSSDLSLKWLSRWISQAKSVPASQLRKRFGSQKDVFLERPEFVPLFCTSVEKKLSSLFPLLSRDIAVPGAWSMVAAALRELQHVAATDDAASNVIDLLLSFPVAEGFAEITLAVLDEKTDAGWVERANMDLLGRNLRELPNDTACEAVKLLLATLERRPNLCGEALLQRMVVQYGGTCSPLDRLILQVVHRCKDAGLDSEAAFGSFWTGGQTDVPFGLDRGALFYQNHLVKEAALSLSVADFPVGPFEREQLSLGTVYDPVFLLPFLRHALSHFFPNCKRFPESGCLAYALMGCSCEEEELRRVAYDVIQRYSVLLDVANFSWKPQIQLLLQTFKASVLRPLQYIPTLVCVFLARISLVLCNPEHMLYEHANNFLLKRPSLDLSSIPLLRETFLVGSEELRRMFFQILACGVRRGADVKLLRKNHVPELMLSFFHHVADHSERGLILHVLQRSCRFSKVALMLDTKFGLLGWLCATVDSAKELQQIASIGLLVLSAWQERMSWQTRELGWILGLKLLKLAEKKGSLLDCALGILGKCVGVTAKDSDLKLILQKSRRNPKLTIVAVSAATAPQDASILLECASLFACSFLLDADTAIPFVKWIASARCSFGNLVWFRRWMQFAMLETAALDGRVLRELAFLVCVVARTLTLSKPVQERFNQCLDREDVEGLIRCGIAMSSTLK